jgi:hypothetical protein
MPRYFFNIRSGAEVDVDEVGIDFVNDAAAELGAVEAAKDTIDDALAGDGTVEGQEIEIVAATGQLIATLPMKVVLNPLELQRRLQSWQSTDAINQPASDLPKNLSGGNCPT